MTISRRTFVATLGAATTAAMSRRSAIGADSSTRVVTLALIGAGGRGRDLATAFSAQTGVRFKYVCDVESTRAAGTCESLEQAGASPRPILDMRQALDDRDIDAVVIALPEHWHALATIWACQAGKDVYVEKNLATTIWEGRRMIEAARKYQRIIQAGFQCRSAPYAATARQYIQSGRLGKVAHVKVYNMLSGRPWKAVPDAPAPAGLDWDRWLGPAPAVPYNPSRHRGWYYWYDYCGGTFGGDASHQLDLARMVLGDPADPKAIYCAAGNFAFGSECPTPEMMAITYEYPDFTMTCESANFPPYMRKSNDQERNGDKFPFWPQNNERIEIYGTKQMMYVGRHGIGWQVFEGDGKLVAQEKGKHPDRWHQADFIDCIRTRKTPNADVEQAHHSAILVHSANAAHRVGNLRLAFDSATERFDNSAANALLTPVCRDTYRLPERI